MTGIGWRHIVRLGSQNLLLSGVMSQCRKLFYFQDSIDRARYNTKIRQCRYPGGSKVLLDVTLHDVVRRSYCFRLQQVSLRLFAPSKSMCVVVAPARRVVVQKTTTLAAVK